jgi:hypothetical protein
MDFVADAGSINAQAMPPRVKKLESSSHIPEADAAMMDHLAEAIVGNAVGDSKVQLMVILAKGDGYPVGGLGFFGDMFKGVFDKGHQNKGGDGKVVGREVAGGKGVYLKFHFDIVVLAKLFQLDRIFQISDLLAQWYLSIVAFV